MTPIARFDDLAGRVAVVTGASRGLGAAAAHLLAANGMRIALIARDTAALDDVREEIWNSGGRAMACVADCTRPDELTEAASLVEAELGPVDVLAAFAGGNGRPESSLDMTIDTWRHVIDGDLTSTFATIAAFAPGMVKRGRGSIVTMASSAGRAPSQANVAYAVAKAGVVMLTRHLAAELAPQGVRVNAIAPSAVRTEKFSPDLIATLSATFPLGRMGEPADIAAVTAFLASDASGWITGVTLDVAGGRVIP